MLNKFFSCIWAHFLYALTTDPWIIRPLSILKMHGLLKACLSKLGLIRLDAQASLHFKNRLLDFAIDH